MKEINMKDFIKTRRIMTIFVAVLFLIAVIVVPLTSCNMGIVGNYSFNKVHIFINDGEDACLDITSWYDNETGCEVKCSDGSAIFLSEGTYALIEGECPICNGGK